MPSIKVTLLMAALLLAANCANARILSELTSNKFDTRALLGAKDPRKISSELGAKGKGFGYGKIGGEWQVEEPVVTDPVVTDPVVTDPVVTDPLGRRLLGAKDPRKISSELGAKGKGFGYGKIGGEWQVEEPVVTDPVVTDPVVTDPVVTDPVVTAP